MNSFAVYVLTLSCPNKPGIVSAISSSLFELSGDIIEAQQHDDSTTGKFFMRVVFTLPVESEVEKNLKGRIKEIAHQYGMHWKLHNRNEKKRVLVMVSRFDHCLVDLLYRWRINELAMIPTAIVANHPKETYAHIDMLDIPFYYLPVTRDTKHAQEEALEKIIEETQTDLVVLARYMQVLSDQFSRRLHGRCINIHHSFLPGFKGAKPYHQAYDRGVKIIGATAHYVTPDLDEGPIIEQAVARVTHADTPDTLIRKGRDIERQVLAQAVRFHLEDRIILNERKTVVFAD